MAQRVAHGAATRITPEEAAGLVRSHSWLDFGVALAQPDRFDQALATRADELVDVKIRSCLSVSPRAFLEADPDGRHFHSFSWHFSGYDRSKHDEGICNYIPLNLGEVPDYYRRFIEPIDLVVLKTCPMDEHGWFNFGPTAIWHRTLVERAKTLIVEVSPAVPYVHGDCRISSNKSSDRPPVIASTRGNFRGQSRVPRSAPSGSTSARRVSIARKAVALAVKYVTDPADGRVLRRLPAGRSRARASRSAARLYF